MAELIYGTYPHPGFTDRLITTKPEGMGWNNLGKRKPEIIFLHRMLGTLWGTDAFFRNPSVAALTDYGLGVETQDGGGSAGTILRWVDPTGNITPWASGPVNQPYGDALCLINHHKGDANCVNKNGVSIEISGFQNTPIDDYAFTELVKLCAYWADQMGFPFDDLTHSPKTGCALLAWHEEACFGTGKKCPFDYVKDRTDELYQRITNELMPYQLGEPAPEPPPPEPESPDETADDPGEAALPEGMSTEYAERLYGEVWINGVEIAYDYNHDIASRHWLQRYAGQIPAGGNYHQVPWPFLVDVIRRGSGVCTYQWSDGHLYDVPPEKQSAALKDAFA